jgi:urea-proton symporter
LRPNQPLLFAHTSWEAWPGKFRESVLYTEAMCSSCFRFAIPFGFATTLGLAAVALTDNPKFPTYPNVPDKAQISAGLAASFAASTLMGTGGAVALLIVLFMAVTSCASAELIAVSSILTFDVFKTYIKPSATPKQLIFVAHVMICVFGLTMAMFACIWNAIGIDLGWLFLVMGLLIGGAVFPVAFAITWKGQTKAGAISGSLSGLSAGLVAWLTTANQYYGAVSITTTGLEYPTLAGNLAAIMTGLIVSVAVSLIKPTPFDWEITRSINSTVVESTKSSVCESPSPSGDLAKVRDEEKEVQNDIATEEEPSKLHSAFKIACIASFVITFIMDFLVPMPMFFAKYVFSQGFFTAWVAVSFVWTFCSAAISTILPIVETAGFFKELVVEICADLKGKN